MSALGRISNTIGSLGVNLNVDLDETTMSAIQEQNIKINNIDQELDNLESELKEDSVALRNLLKHEQVTVKLENLVKKIQE